MTLDQRRYKRTERSEELLYFDDENIRYPGTIIDMSEYGLGVKANIAHRVGDELCFEGIEYLPLTLSGVVKWVHQTDDEDNYSMGIELEGAKNTYSPPKSI